MGPCRGDGGPQQSHGVVFYLNGMPVIQGDATLVPGKIMSGNSVRIGASHRKDGFPSPPSMTGLLDEVQIYHRALFDDEVAALRYADCGGACKVRVHVSKVTPFCDGQFFSDAIVTIDNATDTGRLFRSPGRRHSRRPEQRLLRRERTGINSGGNVQSDQCAGRPVDRSRWSSIDQVGIEDGDSGCWTATIEEIGHGHGHAAQGDRLGCRLSASRAAPTACCRCLWANPLRQIHADQRHGQRLLLVLEDRGGRIHHRLLNRVIKLNNEEPGGEVFGYTHVPPDSSVAVIVDVTYLRQRADEDKEESKYSDVTYESPGTDVPRESSDSVGSEPVSAPIEEEGGCGADVDCDGVVDVTDLLAVIAAWGECPAADPCTADTNGDGMVDVTDLLAIIASWG